MDPQQQTPQPVLPQTQSSPPSAFSTQPKKKSHKFLLIIFAFFILVFVGASGYFFGLQEGMQMPKKQISPQSSITKKAQAVQSPEITNKTKVAKSLTLPKFDPNMQWSDLTKVASDDGTMEIMADKSDEQYILIPFKDGKFYQATGAASVDLNSYFSSRLKQLGWVTPDSTDSFLTFKTFRLRGLIAQGTCGGVVGYVGYKDGKVRMVAIKQAAQTCLPPDQVKNNTSLQQQVIYTVYVSDPTPVQYFSNIVSAHGKK